MGRPDQPISRLVIRSSITVGPDDALLKAATVMASKQIRRLPLVCSAAAATDDGGSQDRRRRLVADVEAADRGALAAIKEPLRQGAMVFEELQAESLRRGGRRLLDALARIPPALDRFHADVERIVER